MRLGSPAVSDGGIPWLNDFIDKADAVANPDDAKGAADQLYHFLKGINEVNSLAGYRTKYHRHLSDYGAMILTGTRLLVRRIPFRTLAKVTFIFCH